MISIAQSPREPQRRHTVARKWARDAQHRCTIKSAPCIQRKRDASSKLAMRGVCATGAQDIVAHKRKRLDTTKTSPSEVYGVTAWADRHVPDWTVKAITVKPKVGACMTCVHTGIDFALCYIRQPSEDRYWTRS